MYSSPSPTEFYQGDIVPAYPFLNFAQTSPLSIDEENVTLLEVGAQEITHVGVKVDPRNIMIISQTCDAQRRENLIVCPLYTVNEYITASNPNADKLRSLRDGKIYYWLYLPTYQDVLEESFVDLQQFLYIPRVTLETYKDKRILSLNDLGRHRLAWSISSFFGRPL